MGDVKLMTIREVSEVTRLSKSMVHKLLDQSILHRVRLPGCTKVLIAEDELRRYVSEGLKAGAAPLSA
jgi:excisionase family DNA binding protein